MENTFGAENMSAEPPAAGTQTEQARDSSSSPAPDLGNQEASEATASSPQPESGDQGQEENSPIGDTADGAPADQREKFIPRERFDQRDQQFKAREAELVAETREWQDAAALGIADRSQYQALVKEAAAYGYPDARAYLDAVQQQQAVQQEMAQIQDRYDLTDEAKAELIAAKQERLQNAQQLAQARYLNQQMLERTLETAVTEAKTMIGQDLPPELEALLRQSSPENIKVAAKSIKALLDGNAKNSVAEYAAIKAKDAQIPAPEGRGGDPPAPRRAAGGKDFKETSFSSLLGFTKKSA